MWQINWLNWNIVQHLYWWNRRRAVWKIGEMWTLSTTEGYQKKLGIEDEVDINHCHRMKKSENNRSNSEGNLRPRTVICRLLRFKDKQRITRSSKKLNNAGIFIYEDFCKETIDHRKQLWEKVLEHWANNKIDYLTYRGIVAEYQRNTAG